ncbi:MAG: glycosyltransferase family 2 protein [Chitinophagaceae bacterium]
MQNNTQGISVVIPNYNGMELLPQTLPTVFKALQKQPLPFEVIVCDDASTDESVLYVKQHYPEIKLIVEEENAGFAATANDGIRQAAFDWVLLLNSDVKLTPDYFKALLPYMHKPDCFAVMGRIVGWQDEEIQDGAKYPNRQGVKIKTSGNYLLEDMSQTSSLLTMYVSGANMFLQKKIFDDIGQLNEIFSPFYVEDYELSLRAWRLGYKCYYEYNAVCHHKTSHTIKKQKEKTFVNRIYNRNKMFLHAIHLQKWSLYLWQLQLLFECLGRAIIGQFYFLKAYEEYLRNSWEIKRSRNQLKKAAAGKKLKTVAEVMQQIKNFISNKPIIRF